MFELLAFVVVAAVSFVGGVWVGVYDLPTVDKAITALKAAEKSAQATLSKITTHKAS